jgi:hypothetical protein
MTEDAERMWGDADIANEEVNQADMEAHEAREQAGQLHEHANRMRGEADWVLDQERAREEGADLMVAAFPTSGDPHRSPCPDVFEVFFEPERNNETAPLAFGTYDVHVEWVWHGDERELHQCARLTIEIDGDVRVPAPEMGECP